MNICGSFSSFPSLQIFIHCSRETVKCSAFFGGLGISQSLYSSLCLMAHSIILSVRIKCIYIDDESLGDQCRINYRVIDLSADGFRRAPNSKTNFE